VTWFDKPPEPTDGSLNKKAAAIILVAGLIWAFCSDAMISDWGRSLPHGSLELLRGANNVVLFSIATIVLYRRLRKQQRQLILSEEQYRNLFDSNPNPMWIYHKKTLAFIAVNDAATIKYGYSRDEFLNMTIKDIRPAEDLVLLDESIKNDNGSTGKSDIWQHIRKSGEVFPVSIVSHNVWFNQGSCKMVMATDITLARKNEQILRDSYLKEKELREELAVNYELIRKSEKENKFIAQVIDRINNLVLVVTEDGIISWVNRAFTDFTGYTADEVIGKNPGHILFGPETDSETIKRLIQSTQQKKYFSEELVNYKKSGESYWTQLAISPIYDENGNFQFFMSVETIITERKEKEQKILAQHAALQKIAWSNSHELRRPVCTILGLIAVLKDADCAEDRDHCLAALETCTWELDEMVKDINQRIDHLELNQNLVY